MAAADLSLVITTFAQHWDHPSGTLKANVVLIPAVDPVGTPLITGTAAPAFADNAPAFEAVVIGSLDQMPKMPVTPGIVPTIVSLLPNKPSAFAALAAQASKTGVTIKPNGPRRTDVPKSVIRKALPQSYVDLTGARPSGFTATVDEFGCAIQTAAAQPAGAKPPAEIRWGELLSYALRQPTVATALGMRYELSIVPTDPSIYKDGGWLFVKLADTDPWAKAAKGTRWIRLYASRIPPLNGARQLFAAITFPVDTIASDDDDAAIIESQTYDDGFAKLLHLHQPSANDAVLSSGSKIPAATDVGIQIGWDDEQITEWHNRQIRLLSEARDGSLDGRPALGVLGYRLDVADVTGGGAPPLSAWHSLMHADVTLPASFGSFSGELSIEPTPVRPQGSDESWLPLYFAMWRGGSLVRSDPVPRALMDRAAYVPPSDPVGLFLSYGKTYAFRVRLADLSGGSAASGDGVLNDGPAAEPSITFRRHVPPKSPRIEAHLPGGATIPDQYTFFRPLIGYPEVLFTGLGANPGTEDADRQAIISFYVQNAQLNATNTNPVGLPDPDAETLVITVEVRTPLHDVAGDGELDSPYRVVYRTRRPFPPLPPGATPTDSGLTLDVAYVDAASIVDWKAEQAPSGPLLIPRARDVRITAHAELRDDPDAIAPAAQVGLVARTTVRAESRVEPPLLIPPVDGQPALRGFLFRRPPGIDAPPVAAQLAQELHLVVEGLTLSAPPGQRIVFGASKALRHTLSGDTSALSFSSASELLRHWVIALVFELERDWTWDCLKVPKKKKGELPQHTSILIRRDGDVVGSIALPTALGPAATADPEHWDRRRTRMVFFDAVDPHEPTPSGFPEALDHAWTLDVTPTVETGPIVGAAGTPLLAAPPSAPGVELRSIKPGDPQPKLQLTLPIAIPPSQIPEIASVGLALSPYAAGPGYATTGQRQRVLWIELKQPIENDAGDALFARVLAHGADPLLYDPRPDITRTDSPPLTLDPEIMRVIVPIDSDNRAGIDAMTKLERATDSKRHYLLPLPPGIDPDDPELFGFYTYELRVGHDGEGDPLWWSTAQQRFGRPLRVNGVQHPAPPLACRAGRVRFNEGVFSGGAPAPDAALVPSALFKTVEKRIKSLAASNTADVRREIVRDATFVLATAPYATPVLNGRSLVSFRQQPKTTLCFFLYAQVVQADGESNRNVLLLHRYGAYDLEEHDIKKTLSVQRDRVGHAIFSNVEIADALAALGLPTDLPLSILAVELLPGGVGNALPSEGVAIPAASPAPVTQRDPLGTGLNDRPQRILRVSPLIAVAPAC